MWSNGMYLRKCARCGEERMAGMVFACYKEKPFVCDECFGAALGIDLEPETDYLSQMEIIRRKDELSKFKYEERQRKKGLSMVQRIFGE